jgi:Protein of unknown function (DUF2782)
MNPKLALALACACAPCWAQTAPAEPVGDRAEPNVKHVVIEDEGSKIDELRVRGQVQRVTVTPKVGVAKPYEIIVSRGGRTAIAGDPGTGGAVGKRVWTVLDF